MSAYVADAGRWRSPRLQPGGRGGRGVGGGDPRPASGSDAQALCVATLDSGRARVGSLLAGEPGQRAGLCQPAPVPVDPGQQPHGTNRADLGVRGPTFTIVGRADALTAALEQALEELASGRARRVLVAALDGITLEETRLAAVSLVDGDAAESLTTRRGRLAARRGGDRRPRHRLRDSRRGDRPTGRGGGGCGRERPRRLVRVQSGRRRRRLRHLQGHARAVPRGSRARRSHAHPPRAGDARARSSPPLPDDRRLRRARASGAAASRISRRCDASTSISSRAVCCWSTTRSRTPTLACGRTG